ncbi:prolipoprotein diacylglyceryl transferase [Solicola sp. PLA-1-18]|uniref:prolipoprotein diacylglyceryl transferase n=1 Tax=Solicola sp. PLA-1-18 TaxID=3380532 RepID=UPI003B7C2320
MVLASIPSPDPSQAQWSLGPFTIHAYALCILAGVAACLWLSDRRWIARGGRPGTVYDVAVWAIPAGLIGARLYHVITSWNLYFGEGKRPIEALYIWNGGLGIWGSIALGALGAYIGCRRAGADFRVFADVVAPGILLAQAIGRWGNWFNQELFGGPTDLPWGLRIDPQFRPEGYAQYDTFHPTFLYESLWSLAGVALLLWADRRWQIGYGRLFALYVMVYCAGRGWIEAMRVDEAFHIGPFRLNVWTALILFLLAAAYFVRSLKNHPGRETDVQDWDDEDAVPATAPDDGGGSVDAGAADADDAADDPARDPGADAER